MLADRNGRSRRRVCPDMRVATQARRVPFGEGAMPKPDFGRAGYSLVLVGKLVTDGLVPWQVTFARLV